MPRIVRAKSYQKWRLKSYNNQMIKFIKDCFSQLKPNGFMIFTLFQKKHQCMEGAIFFSKDRYALMKGLNVYFYDSESVKQEFENYGLIEFSEIDEPIKHMENEPPLKCMIVKCKKND